ncbi:NAD(P)H-binding protein [Ferrimonas sp. YFM]|uniref:NAD(P)H-binding protein n=1 Tax=Ferrimonas sp. YFM TaxID=3028878 RepID=UPI002573F2DD|nr:NAD(P)H-binding protein [Ferrimonas sp. YFM]BDY04725.1 NAD(P)-dependent oxidoreductase [Ferrimonas sp. YFM]
MSHILVVGAGWLGLPLSAALTQAGHRVTATRRSSDGLQAIADVGATPLQLDLQQPIPALPQCDLMVLCLPPGRQPDAAPFHERLTPLFDAAAEAGVTKVLFTSATSVYGSVQGRVDERAELDSGERAARMLKVEQEIRARFDQVTVLRLAGLVGGERHPGRFLAGKSGLLGAQDPVNLVHRDDVISAILALIGADLWGETFNLASPHHPGRKAYYLHCARCLGLAAPSFDSEHHQPRWVVGDKIAQALGWRYRHTNLYALPELTR